MQVLGLLVEVMNKSFQKHISSILPVSKTILQAAVGVASESPALDLHDEAVPLWKAAYYSLVLLEKILHHFHDLSFEKDFEVWLIQVLLSVVHSHSQPIACFTVTKSIPCHVFIHRIPSACSIKSLILSKILIFK